MDYVYHYNSRCRIMQFEQLGKNWLYSFCHTKEDVENIITARLPMPIVFVIERSHPCDKIVIL